MQSESWIQKVMERLERSATVHLLVLGFLGLLLLIPIAFVYQAISDRSSTRREAVQEIANTWGLEQTVTGPMIVVPYQFTYRDNEEKLRTGTSEMIFLPETLDVSGDLQTEVRYRGIYQANLYVSTLQLKGSFAPPDFTGTQIEPEKIEWSGAKLVLGITDPKAIRETVAINWSGTPVEAGPGKGAVAFLRNGISAPLKDLHGKQDLTFSVTLKLAGTSELRFAPFGKETTVSLQSQWRHPSFVGGYLPVERTIGDEGFRAQWKVLHLGRGYPQRFTITDIYNSETQQSEFGVSLVSLVDHYVLTERSVKYGVLFVFVTFLAFFMFELLSGMRVHPIQYLLVGIGQALFFLLLLAFTEHLPFGVAYLIGASATTIVISAYALAVVKKRSAFGFMLAGLGLLYCLLYSLLRLEDYALLVGSVGLFVVVSVVMWVTRHVDWYKVELGRR
jgi:inner membrane protein